MTAEELEALQAELWQRRGFDLEVCGGGWGGSLDEVLGLW